MTTPIQNAIKLRAAANQCLEDAQCDHRNSEHGNCHDCMNHGYIITCEQEQDIFTACLTILKATDDIAETPPDPTVITEARITGITLTTGTPTDGVHPVTVTEPDRRDHEIKRLKCELIEARNPGIETDPKWIAERAARLAAPDNAQTPPEPPDTPKAPNTHPPR